MAKDIFFITSNKSKFEEAKLLMGEFGVAMQMKDLKLLEPQSTDQEEVVMAKAKEAYRKLKRPIIVDDTGIFFEEYLDFPGTYTKNLFKAIGFKGMSKLLSGAKKEAYFRTLVCYKDQKETKVFSGVWKGKIVGDLSRMYNPEWQYNSIFVPQGFNTPLSEIPIDIRAKKSHRKKAFDSLKKYLRDRRSQ